MDKLWLFSDSGAMYGVPLACSILDAAGNLKPEMQQYVITPKDVEEFRTFCECSEQIILIAGKEKFNEDYLAAIPAVMPRVGLIKTASALATREQLDILAPIKFLFEPFLEDAVRDNLEQSLEDKTSLKKLQEELRNYSNIAFTAMSSASEMGVVAFYAQAVQNIADMKKLAEQTISCLKDLSVQGYLRFSFEDSAYIYPENMPTSYKELLGSTGASSNRIISHGRFLIFNFENAQFLITDAPQDDMEKYGRLRDVIAHLVSIAEARAKTIKVNTLLKQQQDNTRMVMMLLEMASRDNRNSVKTIMMDLSASLRVMAVSLDLSLNQETELMKLSEKALESLECLHEATDAVELHFRSLLVQLDQAAKLLETTAPSTPTEIEAKVELF